MRSTIASSTCGQTEPVTSEYSASAASPGTPGGGGGLVMSSIGTITPSSKVLDAGGATISTGAEPPRNRATSSIGRTVAESPMRCAGVPMPFARRSASRRSRLTARCAPRLVAATACTSSMITVCTPRSVSPARLVSMRYRDSGVVMRMSGGSDTSLRRSLEVVSPERTPTVTAGAGTPSRLADCPMPIRGERRLRSTSTPSAFNGEM